MTHAGRFSERRVEGPAEKLDEPGAFAPDAGKAALEARLENEIPRATA